MFNIKYEDIIKKIKENTNLNDNDLKVKINEKLEKLNGLISKEGAAHIVANELGVKIFEDVGEKKLKIKDLLVGMRGVEILGKVVGLNEVRDFKTENREGKVGSLTLGDETGTIRIVLWDTEHLKLIEDNSIEEGTLLKIKNSYTRNNNGFLELHLNNRSRIILNPEGESIGEVKLDSFREYVRKEVKDLNEDDRNVGVFGTIVQLFEPRFFEICGECSKRVNFDDGKFICEEHGSVVPKFVPVLNLFFDDGSDSIRAVVFRGNVGKVLGLNEKEVLELKDNLSKFEGLKSNVLGNQILLVGRVTKNEMFNKLEFVVNSIEEGKHSKEVKKEETESDAVEELEVK